MDSLKLNWKRAAAWRLQRQHLNQLAPAGSLLRVASRLCGLHAQVLSSAELTVWARVEGLKRGDVQHALWEQRSLVKTWAMRGTLHLLPSSELPLWHAVLSTGRLYARPKVWEKHFGITMQQLDQITEAISTALRERCLTREELVQEVGRLTGSATLGAKLAESSWGTMLKPAAFRGGLCFAPSVGQRVRFTHPGTWAGAQDSQRRFDRAGAAVVRRYLEAYGPATQRDIARWWGGTAAIREWVASLADEVCRVDLEGEQAWMLKKDAREAAETSIQRTVRLIPGFDQYVVAASPHAERLMPEGLRSRVYRPQGWISPILLVNGRMEGVWRHELKGSRIEVVIEPFDGVAAWVRKGAKVEAERLAEFFGGKLAITWKV
jgi:uncharacterized protein YcaQ